MTTEKFINVVLGVAGAATVVTAVTAAASTVSQLKNDKAFRKALKAEEEKNKAVAEAAKKAK